MGKNEKCTHKSYLFKLKNVYPDLSAVYEKAKKDHILLIRNTKKEYFQNKISNSENPGKAAWDVISQLSNKPKNSTNISLNIDGVTHTDPFDIASSFNKFFLNAPKEVIKKISSSTPTNKSNVSSKTMNFVNNPYTIYLMPFTSDELYNILKMKLKSKSSTGPDNIPSFLIKKTLAELIKPLTYLVNLSFRNGEFPAALKLSTVTPVFKKLDPHNIENYRPISISSCFSKVFEYCFLNRLLNFLKHNNVITNNQHGFRDGKSTTSAMHDMYSRIIECLETGECPIGIYCDLSRAFDCVDYEVLLNKLWKYGIRGVALDWISSFLRNRKQCVSLKFLNDRNVNKTRSEYAEVNMGVPQGSILGPILFLLYINELDTITSDAKFTIYADDTSLIVSNKSNDILELTCNDVLSKLNSWFALNSLYFNVNKTEFVRFHNRQKQCAEFNIKINEQSLSGPTKNVKFLGLIIDEHLNWKDHSNFLVSKLNSLYYLFRNLKTILTKDQLLVLYYAQVGSRLSYGVCFWGNSTSAQDVFVAQKRIVRIIANLSSIQTCRNAFKDYKIFTLTCIYIYEISMYIFKNRRSFPLNRDVHGLETRKRNDFCIPICRYHVTYCSPNYLGLKIFNHLPSELKECTLNMNNFKNKLKLYLHNKCFYSLHEFFNGV